MAEVSDSVENRYSSGFHNHQPAIIALVTRQPDANVVATIDAIKATLPQLQAILPPQASLTVVMDRSLGIRGSLAEAQWTLVFSCLIVAAVVWLFVARLRTALIPVAVIPVSLIGTFAVIWLAGFSLNNLSIMALVVAAGLVVDDAIVVLENITRHTERGLSPYRAAMRGAGEVSFTLLALNVALVVVFVAVLFMGGIIERLFREFSLTLAAAIVISLVVSISLTPALCAHVLPRERRQKAAEQGAAQAAALSGDVPDVAHDAGQGTPGSASLQDDAEVARAPWHRRLLGLHASYFHHLQAAYEHSAGLDAALRLVWDRGSGGIDRRQRLAVCQPATLGSARAGHGRDRRLHPGR